MVMDQRNILIAADQGMEASGAKNNSWRGNKENWIASRIVSEGCTCEARVLVWLVLHFMSKIRSLLDEDSASVAAFMREVSITSMSWK